MVWTPVTESDIQRVIDAGDLGENHALEFKRQTGNSDASRKETAADMASFALHGGQLVIGIAEDKETRNFSLSPQPLEGAVEKLESIAQHRIDPPLFIRVREVPSDADSLLGYLFVEVPPSPTAPHMVEGRYFARVDRTKQRMSDAAVVQAHASRRHVADQVQDELDAWVSRDVVGNVLRLSGHLHVVAEPLSQFTPSVLMKVTRAKEPNDAQRLAMAARRDVPQTLSRFSPMPGRGQWVRRAQGGALTSLRSGVPRLEEGGEEDLVDLEFRDNGGFRILMGRLTDIKRLHIQTVSLVFDIGLVAYAAYAVALARHITDETGYRGAWGFGVNGDLLAGHVSFVRANDMRNATRYVDEYSANDYSAIVVAQLAEIEDAPHTVVERLVGGLLHALGSHEYFFDSHGLIEE